MSLVCQTLDEAIGLAYAIDDCQTVEVLRRLIRLNAAYGRKWALHRRDADGRYLNQRISQWLDELENLEAECPPK